MTRAEIHAWLDRLIKGERPGVEYYEWLDRTYRWDREKALARLHWKP